MNHPNIFLPIQKHFNHLLYKMDVKKSLNKKMELYTYPNLI